MRLALCIPILLLIQQQQPENSGWWYVAAARGTTSSTRRTLIANTNLLVVAGRRIRMPHRQSAVLQVGQGVFDFVQTDKNTKYGTEQDDDDDDDETLQEVSHFAPHECVDQEEECAEWAEAGDCVEHPRFMMDTCRVSCGSCDTRLDLDMGEAQVLQSDYTEDTFEKILAAREYLNQVWYDDFLSTAYDVCVNKDPQCAYWAVIGECESEEHEEWMSYNCAPVCQTCHVTSVHTRCPLDPEAQNAWGVGDVHAYFEHITTADEFLPFEPHVWSRPDYAPGDTEETANYILGPWLVTMENYVTQEEALRMIELGRIEGYQRSTEFGEENEDGTLDAGYSEARTSMNSWCDNDCAEDPVAVDLLARMSHLAGMPSDNAESFQLLRYLPGQFYKVHHDFSEHECHRQQGPRILTIFLYLNEVEEGGGTNFPNINLTVTPKRGRVVLWPSVLDEYPEEMDIRTEHQALAVEKGLKFGANLWFHQRNYKDPSDRGCTM